MKSSAITIVVNLFLSSSSTVVGIPHAPDLGFQSSLSVRSIGQRARHSQLGDRLIETGPKSLFKRGNVEEDAHDYHGNENDKGDGDDDEETCEDSSNPSYAENESTPNLHTPYRIGVNSTVTQPPKPKSAARNSSYSATENSSKPDNLAASPGPSGEKFAKITHHIDSQRYHASSDKYGLKSGNVLGHHGFVGSYNGYRGKATFFSQGGSPGACGKVHEDSDYVVAIQSQMYDDGKFCGKTILVTRKSTGKSIKCLAADECPGCPSDQSLDLSIAAFNALGEPDEGIFDIHWQVLD